MNKQIVMYSSKFCGDCHAARHFLSQHHVEFQEVDINESPEAAKFVMQINNGKRSIPTFDIDGAYLNASPFTPENRKKLAEAIGLEI